MNKTTHPLPHSADPLGGHEGKGKVGEEKRGAAEMGIKCLL